ncbi:hypothetical protein Tco_1031155 [Tanacetum coccineum]|uniref:Uncharacterized protein n=1 Tax=Tanacetum coccineum TaxID=301880 RepID=A0ABQ5G9X3_9ASTR
MRNRMCTYLKNMGGYKHNQLKGKSYEEIQKLFDKPYKQVNSFVPMASDDKEKGSEKKAGGSRKKTLAKKRAGEKQSKESSKRQKMEDDAEKEELRAHLDIIPRDDVAVSVESLATKYPIVDWKTHVLSEDKMYYEIIRANRSTKSYKIFIEMLDDFNKHDVKDDEVWKAQQDYTLISWRLFDSCGIHVLLMDTGIAIYMLVVSHVVDDFQSSTFDTLGFPALKYYWYIRLNSNSNSCCDVAVSSAGGTTFGTIFELDGSLLWS